MNKGILITIFSLLIATIVIINFSNSAKKVPSEKPKYRDIQRINFYVGKFEPYEMVFVQPEISGVVEDVYVVLGQKISIGTPLAKIKIIAVPSEIERAESAMLIAMSDLKQNKINHSRNIQLFEKGVIASATLEVTELALRIAQINLKNAQNNMSIARNGFSKNANESPNIVKATIEGEVLNVLVKKGMNVTERNTFNDGTTLATIVNNSSFNFVFKISEIDLYDVNINDTLKVSIKAFNNKMTNAIISELKPLIKPDGSFYYEVVATVLDSTLDIKPGFTGLGEITLEKKHHILSIKEKNIIYKNRKAYLEIINQDEEIFEIEVVTGISDGVYTEIKRGLKLSDLVKLQ